MDSEMEKVDFVGKKNAVFSTRQPTDTLAGISSGLKSVGKGVGLGVGTLIGAPIIGAKENGVKGFCLGLVGGAVAGVTMMVTGASVGMIFNKRGVLNRQRYCKYPRDYIEKK